MKPAIPTYEVAYEFAPGLFSVNMVKAHTLEDLAQFVNTHAARHGYRVAYTRELSLQEVVERLDRGMPACTAAKSKEDCK